MYPADGNPRQVAEVKKHPDALFQPPGCSVDSMTTMDLPSWVVPSIDKKDLILRYLDGWELAMEKFIKSSSGEEDTSDDEMEE